MRATHAFIAPTLVLLLAAAPLARAADPTACAPADDSAQSSAVSGALVLDEHLLTDGSKDRDYDGGGELTFSGSRGGIPGRALDAVLGSLDRAVCVGSGLGRSDSPPTHAFAAGLLIFTPQNLRARSIVSGDRPYASLFFISEGRRYTRPDDHVAYDSSLTVGLLGLTAAEDVQSTLHRMSSSDRPSGWSHQIAAGGEPTARYSLARQAHLAEFGAGALRGDSKWTLAGTVGTVTEASIAIGSRFGLIESPFWSFAPEENMYVPETQPVAPPLPRSAPAELFGFAGARFKVRGYDAFLEGQFRHSDLRYNASDLNTVIGEAWAGAE
jgi:hypothetical protein